MIKKVDEVGRHFGKFDLDRTGFFHDPPPGPFDLYEPSKYVGDRYGKFSSGQTGGLFEKEFKRLFVGEALKETWTEKNKQKVKILIPPSPAKLQSTPGDWHGCIGEQPQYFSSKVRDDERKHDQPKRPNFKIKPNPVGGPGYADICFNPYPKYAHEPYEIESSDSKNYTKTSKFHLVSAPQQFFSPNPYYVKNPQPTYVRPSNRERAIIKHTRFYVPFPKKPGGKKDGCFDKYPTYMSEPYGKQIVKSDVKSTKPKWVAGGPEYRSKYTTSIIEYVTKVSCNGQNYPHYVERVFPLR